MKYNKGFAPLAVLLVILGIVIVGGGAYMIGKNASTTEVIPVVQEVEETPAPAIKEPTKTASTECTATSSPSITVLSPNGGETYKAGEKINVKWKSCNLSASTLLEIDVRYKNPGGMGGANHVFTKKAPNNGSATVTLPTNNAEWDGENGLYYYGKNYSIVIFPAIGGSDVPSDASDSYFTINQASVSTTLPKYVGTFSICGDGSLLCWPPKVTTSTQAYSCSNAGVAPNTEGNDVTTQRVINGKTYCIHSQSSGYTGGRGYEYTYTTANGSGTKIATFGINYVSCASYDDPAISECKTSQDTFKAGLDALIDSVM